MATKGTKKKTRNKNEQIERLEEAADYVEGLMVDEGRYKGFDLKSAVRLATKGNKADSKPAEYPDVDPVMLRARIKSREEARNKAARPSGIYSQPVLEEVGLPPTDNEDENIPGSLPMPLNESVSGITFTAKGDHTEIAQKLHEYIVRQCDVERLVYDEAQLYRYMPTLGRWVEVSDDALRKILDRFSKRPIYATDLQTGDVRVNDEGEPIIADFMEMTCAKQAGAIARLKGRDFISHAGFFKGAKLGSAFLNGFVEVTKAGLRIWPHSHENRARWSHPVDFPMTSKPPRRFLALLRTLLKSPDCEDKIKAIQEFMGAGLCGIAPRYQRALAFLGKGKNGKSIVLEIIKALFPADSVASVSPQGDLYLFGALLGKLLNLVDDVDIGAFRETSYWKRSITGAPIQTRNPGETQKTFIPICATVLGMNRLFETPDTSHGFYRRWLFVEFPNDFNPAMKAISMRILWGESEDEPGEYAEIIRWAFEGAVRLMRQNDYTLPQSHHVVLSRWKAQGRPVDAFVHKHLTHGGAYIEVAEIERRILQWVGPELRGDKRLTTISIGRRLNALGFAQRKDKGKPAAYLATWKSSMDS
jgi:hypothetical protein